MSGRPSRDEIERALCEAVARISSLPPEDVRPSTRLHKDLGPDSLDWVEFGMWMEDAFPSATLSADPSAETILFRDDVTLAEIAEWIDRSIPDPSV